MSRHSVLLANLILISLVSFSACEVSRPKRNLENSVQVDLSPSGEDVRCFGSSCSNPEESDAAKVKRDAKELIKVFAEDQEQADSPYPHHRGVLASASPNVHPNVWTGTAALYVITAVLARI